MFKKNRQKKHANNYIENEELLNRLNDFKVNQRIITLSVKSFKADNVFAFKYAEHKKFHLITDKNKTIETNILKKSQKFTTDNINRAWIKTVNAKEES